MVSQVICVICSILPEIHTTEITFYKFPKVIESPVLYRAWKTALSDALSNERPELLIDANLTDTYVCSRHFTASDFMFESGKLILVERATPSRLTKDVYESKEPSQAIKITKEYEPSSKGNNFATTLTKDFVTTSRHNLRSDLICTETSRVLTPTVTEYVMAAKGGIIDLTTLKRIEKPIEVDLIPSSKKRLNENENGPIDLELKIQSFEKIFKRMRSDNLLTETYVEQLKVILSIQQTIYLSNLLVIVTK